MRSLKKVIALVAVFAMMISSVAFAATFTDVSEGTVTYEAVETLNALGIIKGYEDGTFGPDKTITRAEYAAVICRAVGLDGIISQSATIFTDVPSTHWASGYINMATQMKVINGMGDGTFEPESPVTYEQAVKMTMVALGYEPKAREKGGYPTGYLVAAADAGVTSDIGAVNSADPAPRGLVARLLYKAIDTPLMEQVVYGGETTYQIQDGTNWTSYKTLMSEKLNVVKLKGIVTSNKYSNIDNNSATLSNLSTKDDTVRIRITDNYKSVVSKYANINSNDNTTYRNEYFRVGNSNADDLLGKRIIVYAKQESGIDDDLIISIVPEGGKNVAISFPIDTYKGIPSANKLAYLKNENDRRNTEVNLATNVNVIYNGRYSPFADVFGSNKVVDENGLSNGTVTLVDTDNTGYYDVIYVDSAEVFVVDTVVASTGRVTAKNNVNSTRIYKTMNLDMDTNSDLYFSITKDGEEVAVSDIKEWDVLSVKINKLNYSDYYYQIKVISEKVEGKVTEVGTSSSSWNPTTAGDPGNTYTINGTEYDLAVNAYLPSTIKTGSNGIFYVDEYGKIAAFQKGSGNVSDNYGYITNVDDASGSFSDRKIVQILQKDGSLVNYRLAKTVNNDTDDGDDTNDTFSGDGSMTGFEEFLLGPEVTGMKYVDGTDTLRTGLSGKRGKLVKFETNANNEIYSIEFAQVNSSRLEDGAFAQHTDGGDNAYSVSKYTYDGDAYKLIANGSDSDTIGDQGTGKTAYLDDNTLVFFIYVKDVSYSSRVDTDKSEVKTMSSLADGAVYPSVQIFDIDDNSSTARAVVVYADAQQYNYTNSLAVINSVSQANNNDGDKVRKISFFQDGEKKDAVTTTDVIGRADALKKGYGAQFTFNSKNEIDGILTVYAVTNAGVQAGIPSITSGLTDNIAGVIATDTDVVRSYTADNTASKKLKVSMGPVVQFRNNRLTVAPWFVGDATTQAGIDTWKGKSTDYVIKGNVNVYVYDESRNDASRLLVGDTGDIDNEYTSWNTLGEGATYGTSGTIAAPALSARDYVIVREYDDAVTDIIVVKAYPYSFR